MSSNTETWNKYFALNNVCFQSSHSLMPYVSLLFIQIFLFIAHAILRGLLEKISINYLKKNSDCPGVTVAETCTFCTYTSLIRILL